MRSAAFFSSNLRFPGLRPTGRAGKLRKREGDMQRRISRAQPVLHRKSLAGARTKPVHRAAARRIRPERKTTIVGFAAMVLH
jgi:hypothetical protein